MSQEQQPKPFVIRDFRPADQRACEELYHSSMLSGQLADNDTGIDIDDIDATYMRRPGNHFWVAEAGGEVVGMIALQHHDEGVGEIRRLRVRHDHRRRGIGAALVEAALKFCQENSYLKVTLDTYMEREPAIKLFEKFRFKHLRSKTLSGKELMYFYLDLYTSDRPAQRKV